jgi:23S rRNA-/tRNA-specific pseudouridylate synthase
MASRRISNPSRDKIALGDALERAGADDRALEEGRVFIGRRRAHLLTETVEPGEFVEIADPREVAPSVPILLRASDLVAVDKPAGMPTIADHGGAAHALAAVAAKTLGLDASRLHATSRLDRGVSGVVVFALTKCAAERLSRARAEGRYERRYLAMASRAPTPEAGTWAAPIGRARDPRLRVARGRDPAPAETRYRSCAQTDSGVALLAVGPKTGRTHQIRVHAAHAGTPLLGDRDYGGPARVTLATGRVLELRRVALHAARVVVPGEDGAPLVARSAVPSQLQDLWSALGGDAAAWELAATCALD